MKANRLALIGIIFGIAGAVLLALFVTSSSGSVSEERMAVLVAGDRGIQPGTDAGEVATMAELREVPLDVVPDRAISTTTDVEGQRVARPVGPGEILTVDQFAPVGPASGGVVVPEGWEAVSIEAQPAPGLEGYATPGSLINVYVTATTPATTLPDGTPDRQGAQPFTQLVLGHTEVLAVTRGTLTGEATSVNDVSAASGLVFLLKLRPADVPTMVFAEQQGQLWFSLANADDPSPVAERVTFDSLDPDAITQSVSEARTQLEQDRARAEAEQAASMAAGTAASTSAGTAAASTVDAPR